MGKLIDPKKKNSIMAGENTATPSDIAKLFGRNPDMTNYVAPQAAAQTVAQPTAGYGQRMQQEADASQARVDDYFKKNPMTGDPFKDIGGLLATREDRRRSAQARQYMEAAEERGVATRGQDIQLELGRGEIGVNTERNRINEKGIDVQKELGLGELEVSRDRNRINEKGIDKQFELGQGELNLNKDIFSQTVKRYNEVGRPADLFNLTEKAAGVRVGAAESGFELSDSLAKETEKYLKGEKPVKASTVATPTTVALDPLAARTNMPQSFGYEPYPDILEAAPITNYGAGMLSQLGGSAVEGVKLIGRTAARIGRLDPLSPSRRYKRKVNK